MDEGSGQVSGIVLVLAKGQSTALATELVWDLAWEHVSGSLRAQVPASELTHSLGRDSAMELAMLTEAKSEKHLESEWEPA